MIISDWTLNGIEYSKIGESTDKERKQNENFVNQATYNVANVRIPWKLTKSAEGVRTCVFQDNVAKQINKTTRYSLEANGYKFEEGEKRELR